jgi:hypothetical protein
MLATVLGDFSDQDQVLKAIYEHPGASSNELAKGLAWAMRDGKPYGVRVRRAAERLAGDGLILKHRGAWVLAAKGEKELNNLERKVPGQNYPLTGGAAADGAGTDGQNAVVPGRPIFPP